MSTVANTNISALLAALHTVDNQVDTEDPLLVYYMRYGQKDLYDTAIDRHLQVLQVARDELAQHGMVKRAALKSSTIDVGAVVRPYGDYKPDEFFLLGAPGVASSTIKPYPTVHHAQHLQSVLEHGGQRLNPVHGGIEFGAPLCKLIDTRVSKVLFYQYTLVHSLKGRAQFLHGRKELHPKRQTIIRRTLALGSAAVPLPYPTVNGVRLEIRIHQVGYLTRAAITDITDRAVLLFSLLVKNETPNQWAFVPNISTLRIHRDLVLAAARDMHMWVAAFLNNPDPNHCL